ncbi:hypothetical protein [Streptomyces sp. NPDC088794]|uniref:hypothetical protein n=1 Tax=Streptomyces sp. NPDC088794 TaxID=3365902 RepID=UPI0038016771
MTDNPCSETGAIGVGMPAVLHLNAFARELTDAFGETPYLVGSAARGKVWRDVDVRLILPDAHFDRLFPEHTEPDASDDLWSFLCVAIAELGRQRTGLPIDFQIQRLSDANHLYPGIRHALGIAHHPRGYDTASPSDHTAAATLARAAAGIKTLRSVGVSVASLGRPAPADDESDLIGATTAPTPAADRTPAAGGTCTESEPDR